MPIVSAFIANANSRPDRDINKYIELGKKLLSIPVPKIIFIDETIIDQFGDYALTTLIPVKRENYLHQYIDQLDFAVNSTYHQKDTLEYILMICNKTEYMREAIALCPDLQMVWVDFGINHIYNSDEFIADIIRLEQSRHNTVRIASIWNVDHDYGRDIYKDISWYFAGGVFGGDSASLLRFAELTKEMCLRVIKERRKIMWEVNIWYKVYLENRELFSVYSCDHNSTLIHNY